MSKTRTRYRFYRSKEIKEKLSCREYLAREGIRLGPGDRIAATWRGGTNETSVHIRENGWHDFATGEGGTVIDLCAKIRFNGNFVSATQYLGDLLGLEQVKANWVDEDTRSEKLLNDGYKETASYDYTDENNTLIYSVVRFEHPERGKTFVHRTPDHEGLGKDTKKYLYNLPAVIKADEVWLVEGEKDVETLRKNNIVATTNSGGASSWENSYNKYLAGKKIIIAADNDEPGRKRGANLVSILKGIAKSVRLIVPSSIEKGDVTDYLMKEGGTIASLLEMAEKSGDLETEPPEIAAAKMANEKDFCNYEMREVPNDRGKMVTMPVPRQVKDMVEDVYKRFLGFPMMLGSTLFDYSRDKKSVVFIRTANELFAWMKRISGCQFNWSRNAEMTSREEFFCILQQSAKVYTGVSNAPHFPIRKDIFYTHDPLPKPDVEHEMFWRLIDFFNPSDALNRKLIAAMFMSPLYYEECAERPMWIIDTDDAQASGKTTLVKMIASLYGNAPASIDMKELEQSLSAIMRRLISSEGRKRRVALMDNVVGTLRSPNLSSLVTLGDLTGIAPYGHGEETRPNDITYMITVNGAQVDTDIATRAYTVRIKKPEKPNPSWEHEVRTFIDEHRLQIYSDMIHMIQTNALKVQRKWSRFGRYDSMVLSAVCSSEEEFRRIDDVLSGESDRSNMDNDRAQEFMELFLETLRASKIAEHQTLFIRSSDIDLMLSSSAGALKHLKQSHIRSFVKQGFLSMFNKKVERFPTMSIAKRSSRPQYRGFIYGNYNPEVEHTVRILKRGAEGKFIYDGDPIIVTPR